MQESKQLLTCEFCNKIIEDGEYCSPKCETFKLRREKMPEYLKSCGVNKLFLNVSYDNIESSIKNKIEKFQDNILFITGKPGVGKTHTAISIIVKKATEDIRVSRFVNLSSLMIDIRQAIKDDEERYILQKYKKNVILILDDIGAEKISDYAASIMYHIIDYRYSQLLPTVITSNYNLDELSRLYNDRLTSRIASGIVIRMNGNDRRISNVQR